MATILKASDYIEKQFHYLTVIEDAGLVRYGKINLNSVLCKCKCGTERVYPLYRLKSGRSKSCGCSIGERSTKHGLARHPLYFVWKSMINRCENPEDEHYKDYGGRGITVCPEWKIFMVFYNWAIANGWKKGLENDRRENNGNYESSNCRFVTRKVNCRNKRVNRIIEFKGEKKCLIEWSECLGISRSILKDRINKLKWPIEKAFTTQPLKIAV